MFLIVADSRASVIAGLTMFICPPPSGCLCPVHFSVSQALSRRYLLSYPAFGKQTCYGDTSYTVDDLWKSRGHKHTHWLRHKCDKTHFSVRPCVFLHPSPVNSALYVVIMFVLVCLCKSLWQFILLTYMSYQLVAHFDLYLDLFLGDFWNFKSLFSDSLPPLNLNKFSEYCIN